MSDEFIDKLVRNSELQNGLGYGGDPNKIAGPYAWTSSEELKVNWAVVHGRRFYLPDGETGKWVLVNVPRRVLDEWIAKARAIAEPAGPQHAYWEYIADAEAWRDGRATARFAEDIIAWFRETIDKNEGRGQSQMTRRNLLASTSVKPPIEPEQHVITIHDMIPGCTYTAVIDGRGVITDVRGQRVTAPPAQAHR